MPIGFIANRNCLCARKHNDNLPCRLRGCCSSAVHPSSNVPMHTLPITRITDACWPRHAGACAQAHQEHNQRRARVQDGRPMVTQHCNTCAGVGVGPQASAHRPFMPLWYMLKATCRCYVLVPRFLSHTLPSLTSHELSCVDCWQLDTCLTSHP